MTESLLLGVYQAAFQKRFVAGPFLLLGFQFLLLPSILLQVGNIYLQLYLLSLYAMNLDLLIRPSMTLDTARHNYHGH